MDGGRGSRMDRGEGAEQGEKESGGEIDEGREIYSLIDPPPSFCLFLSVC